MYDRETRKFKEEIFLASRFSKVFCCEKATLRSDSAYLSNNIITPDTVSLPSDEIAPFFIHFTDGNIIILWASTELDQQNWISAFKRLEQ